MWKTNFPLVQHPHAFPSVHKLHTHTHTCTAHMHEPQAGTQACMDAHMHTDAHTQHARVLQTLSLLTPAEGFSGSLAQSLFDPTEDTLKVSC